VTTRLVLNPVSGGDDALPRLPELNERLRERFGHLDIVVTTAPGDAERAGVQCARDGGTVIVAGGDGTLNGVLNGVHRGGGFDRVRFAVLPLGTGNDFATVLGTPTEPGDALDALGRGGEQAVDVGWVNDRVFVNVSAGGFVAEVSDAVTPALKTVAGRLAYLLGGAQVLWSWEGVAADVSSAGPIEALGRDGDFARAEPLTALHDRLELFAVCNSPLIGGGRPIAPAARIDDGWLDVCLVDEMPAVELAALLGRVAAGAHLDDPRVHYFRVQDLEMSFSRPIKVNTDGEVFETDACRYRVLPGAARFLLPARTERTSTGAR
jgi:diacylglycerol kinase (ATP)